MRKRWALCWWPQGCRRVPRMSIQALVALLAAVVLAATGRGATNACIHVWLVRGIQFCKVQHRSLLTQHQLIAAPVLQPRVEGAAPEHLLCFSALATRALSHEHSHRRALIATSTPQATASQRAALQTRLTRMLPQRLVERHAGSAAVQLELCALGEDEGPQRSMQLLQDALEAVQWSAVPELSGAAPLATVQASFGSFVGWCDACLRRVARLRVNLPRFRHVTISWEACFGLATNEPYRVTLIRCTYIVQRYDASAIGSTEWTSDTDRKRLLSRRPPRGM